MLPLANETTQQTQITTVPPETTVPKATTAPLATEDIPYLRIFDTVSKVDPGAAGTVIRIPELDPTGLVSVYEPRLERMPCVPYILHGEKRKIGVNPVF